ncbi:unnamed protein product [Cunninghamella echinulata]
MTTVSTESTLTSEQKAQKEKFLSKPVNCILFVEKISVKNNIKESEYRKAEVLLERNTPTRGQEYFMNGYQYRNWILQEMTFPILKKKPAGNKKGRTARESSQTPVGSTPPPQPSTPSSSSQQHTSSSLSSKSITASTDDEYNNTNQQQQSQKRKWNDTDNNNTDDGDDLSLKNTNKNKDSVDNDSTIIKKEKEDDDENKEMVNGDDDDDDKIKTNSKKKIKEEDNEDDDDDDDDDGSIPNPKSTFSKKEEIEQLRTSGSMTQCVSEIARIKNFNLIQMGKHEVETWYFSPYPVEYAYCDTLYICEFCLTYYISRRQLERHRYHCQLHHPPGNEIYRHENISFFEIDGRKQRTWCRNLCLLSKLFLDHKTLYYDVDPFLFYCMTERDAYGYHLIGYFSKEKESSESYNVACILTLPQYQRMGYGKLLIAFSYELSKVEGRTGSPEKPLSDLGLLTYRNYWQETIVGFLLAATDEVTIEDISQHTSITDKDILHTLNNIGALRYYRGQHIICLGEKVIEQFERNQQKKKKRVILSEKLEWKPMHFTPSQLRYL